MTHTLSTQTAEPAAQTPAALEPTVTFPVTVFYTEHYTQSPRHRRTLSRRASLERSFAVRFVERSRATALQQTPSPLRTSKRNSALGFSTAIFARSTSVARNFTD